MTQLVSIPLALSVVAIIMIVSFLILSRNETAQKEFEQLPPEIRCIDVCSCGSFSNRLLCLSSIIIIGLLLIIFGIYQSKQGEVKDE